MPDGGRGLSPQTCADLGHPGATYNPWQRKTWCFCGEVVVDGNTASHVACCDGPLAPEPVPITTRPVF